MSSMKKSDLIYYIFGVTVISILIVMFSVMVIDAAYHHYLEEHARPAEVSRGWSPPKIVHHENCALWDEIRKECEDD